MKNLIHPHEEQTEKQNGLNVYNKKMRKSTTFFVRLSTLWRQQRPNETQADLKCHLLDQIHQDLFDMMKISRNTSLDEIIADIQQIVVIRYHRTRNQQISNLLGLSSFQRTENVSNRSSTELHSDKNRIEINERYSANRYVTDSSRYFNNQTQSIEMNKRQEMDSYEKKNPSPLRHTSSNQLSTSSKRLETHRYENTNKRCIFCNIGIADYCCSECSPMNRSQRFRRLLQILEKCSNNLMYHDEIPTVIEMR